jgi:hypothetical protein
MSSIHISVQYWIACTIVLVTLLLLIGALIKRHPFGILIDSRNKLSLSRLQVVLWTLLILSAFCAIALQNSTVSIYMAPELLALMAISTGSTAGAVIIKSTKAGRDPDSSVPAASPSSPPRRGILTTSDKPNFGDMFKGEEIVDSDYVDIAKVQMFSFTLAAIVGYTISLLNHNFMQVPAGEGMDGYVLSFPPISTALVALIGISHAGYLTVKAAPHTPTA